MTERSPNLDSVDSDDSFNRLILKFWREQEGNECLEQEWSTSWVCKLKKDYIRISRADIKSEGRERAFGQLRNPLALCAMLRAHFRKGLREELVYSSDDVSVLLFKMNEKPKAISTAKAKEILQLPGSLSGAQQLIEQCTFDTLPLPRSRHQYHTCIK